MEQLSTRVMVSTPATALNDVLHYLPDVMLQHAGAEKLHECQFLNFTFICIPFSLVSLTG
jgi:hypothetical protein